MPKRSSRVHSSQDVNQLAAALVEAVTNGSGIHHEKNPAAVALGRLGGQKGGRARAESLTATERRKIAQRAAQARWSKKRRPSARAKKKAP
jgi:hypothetical protein